MDYKDMRNRIFMSGDFEWWCQNMLYKIRTIEDYDTFHNERRKIKQITADELYNKLKEVRRL